MDDAFLDRLWQALHDPRSRHRLIGRLRLPTGREAPSLAAPPVAAVAGGSAAAFAPRSQPRWSTWQVDQRQATTSKMHTLLHTLRRNAHRLACNYRLFQLVEHLHGMQGVSGSSPLGSIFLIQGSPGSFLIGPLGGLVAVVKLAEPAMAGAGAADRMARSSARCPLATRPPRAPWRRRRAAGLTAGLALLVPSILPSIVRGQGIVEPHNSSLAPIDREAFRQQYGQEGLFRLRLGVDAAELPPKAGAAPQSCPAATWASSPQKQRYDAAIGLRKFYAAGEALGEWRRLCPTRP